MPMKHRQPRMMHSVSWPRTKDEKTLFAVTPMSASVATAFFGRNE